MADDVSNPNGPAHSSTFTSANSSNPTRPGSGPSSTPNFPGINFGLPNPLAPIQDALSTADAINKMVNRLTSPSFYKGAGLVVLAAGIGVIGLILFFHETSGPKLQQAYNSAQSGKGTAGEAEEAGEVAA
jgi:hypothetical protein